MQTITLQFRVKDKHAARLGAQARAVSYVWNFCNETQRKAAAFGRPWLTGYKLQNLTAGAVKEGLDLSSQTVALVCLEYAKSIRQHRKPWLRWRGKKSLGWVPVRDGRIRFRDGAFVFRGERYSVWLSRPIKEGATFGCGSFSQDARGRWYLNLTTKVEASTSTAQASVGVDLGLSTLATCSDGRKIEMPAFYRAAEQRLASAQRAGKKRLVRTLHAKVADQRRDYLHKASTTLAKDYGLIIVGDASPSQLAMTRMAKSINDAGWSDLKQMLSYKAIRHGGNLIEVNEANTTQTCSECGSVPPSRPGGIAGLGIREWTCDCGAVHDRDVNAARNILRLGLQSLDGGARV